jgi:hypothetical protein
MRCNVIVLCLLGFAAMSVIGHGVRNVELLASSCAACHGTN